MGREAFYRSLNGSIIMFHVAWKLVVFFIGIGLAFDQVQGQVENVFGEESLPANPAGFENTAETVSPPAQPSLPRDDHLVVQSLRQRPPRTPSEYGRAMLYLRRIERWGEMARLLDLVGKEPLTTQSYLQLVRGAGLDVWLAMEQQTEAFNEAQRQQIRTIIDGSSQAVTQREVLVEAVKNLHQPELLERKRGALAIQAAGERGLSILFEEIAATTTPPSPIVSEVVISMGKPGEDALKAALSTQNTQAREQFLQIAARIPGGAYIPDLAAIYPSLAKDSPAEVLVRKALAPNGQAIPLPIAAHRYLVDRMQTELEDYLRFRKDQQPTIYAVWRWSPDGKQLLVENDDEAGQHLERSYQLAMLVSSSTHVAASDSALAAAILLERHHHLSPVVEAPASLFQPWTEAPATGPPADFLGLVWDAARKHRLLAAQLRVVQAMGMTLRSGIEDESTIVPRLITALKESPPVIRYQAAVSATQSRVTAAAFGGKQILETTRQEIAALEPLPLVLVVGGDGERRDILSQQLTLLGFRSTGASSGRAAIRSIQSAQPIEAVFLVDRVLEMPLSELIQKIRSYPRTSALSIAVMTDHFESRQRSLIEDEGIDGIHEAVLTSNPSHTADLIRRMNATSPVPRMDSVDRMQLRSYFEDNTLTH